MIKWCARRRIKTAIRFHYMMRQSIMYARDQYPISQYQYEDQKDELWHKSHCEYVCAQRLEKLLMKYL